MIFASWHPDIAAAVLFLYRPCFCSPTKSPHVCGRSVIGLPSENGSPM
jgi:hypothetical protein